MEQPNEKQIEKELGKLSAEEVDLMVNDTRKTHKKTPWIEAKVLAHLAAGKTKKSAAQLSGITERTFYNWIKSDDVFKARVENAMGGLITLAAIDNIADEVRLGNVEASKWWLKSTKAFDKRYDPKLNSGATLEANPRTGVFEIVEATGLAESLLEPGYDEDLDDEDLDAILYAQDNTLE